MTSLQGEIRDLSERLRHVSSERDYLESSVNRLQLDKLRLAKERDDQLDGLSARYEERIVELHSVIAELTRQLEQKCRETIPEDEEDDEDHEDDGDEDDEEMIEIRGSELASGTSTDLLDARAFEAGKKLDFMTESMTTMMMESGSDFSFMKAKNFAAAAAAAAATASSRHDSTTSLQLLALQEELSDVKERNIQLTARLQQKERDLKEARQRMEEVTDEKEALRSRNAVLEEKTLSPPLKVEKVQEDKENVNNQVILRKPIMRKAERKSLSKIGAKADSDTIEG